MVDDFQTADNCKVMLLSLKAGGAGIELTRANYVFHFDMWWNPATHLQAAGRAWRIGQAKPVFEYFLLTEGTIEERIFAILKEKQELFDSVVDDLSETDAFAATRITNDEIFGLFGLKAPEKLAKKPVLPGTNGDMQSDVDGMPVAAVESVGDATIAAFHAKYGTDVRATDKNLKTLLHVAARCWCVKVAKYLVSNGVNVNDDDIHSRTPLHIAARHGNFKVAEFLISNGANVNAENSCGETPLHIAVGYGEFEIVKCLVSNGANIDVEDDEGNTPLDIARNNDKDDIAEFLISHGAGDIDLGEDEDYDTLDRA
jgi:hypothetical protein